MRTKKRSTYASLYTSDCTHSGLLSLPFNLSGLFGRGVRKYAISKVTFKFIIVAILIFILACSVTVNGNSTERITYYKSVEVEAGDSFWSIAEEYNNLGISTTDYVEKMQRMNKMSGDYIQPGDYVLIAYYK